MPIYTFHLRRSDGAPVSLEAFELDHDGLVVERALQVLGEHPSCSEVAVWCGERRVLTRQRIDPDLRDLLGRPKSVTATQAPD